MKKVRSKAHPQRRPMRLTTPRVREGRVRRPRRTPATASATNDNAATDRELDQYYTASEVAAYLYGIVLRYIDPALYLMFEPSGGTGSFFRLLPPGSRSCDIDPKYPGIETADFFEVTIPQAQPVCVVGNPPFGKNASLAVRFFNHAARQAEVIAFIVPRSFRKASIENRLDRGFRLVHEEPVPADAFLFRGKSYDVPAVFQIWVRSKEPRVLRPVETSHPDFAFVETPDLADFAIRRIGANAGQVHHTMTASPKSNYFIRGDVEAIMRQLDFARVVGNVAGNPSLAKSEIVALYRAYVLARGTDTSALGSS